MFRSDFKIFQSLLFSKLHRAIIDMFQSDFEYVKSGFNPSEITLQRALEDG